MEPEARLMRIAARQHSAFTRTQAYRAGISPSTIDRNIKTSRWRPIHPGVYLPAYVALGWEERIAASVLACGEGAVASYASAGKVWGFLDELTGLHVSISNDRKREPRSVMVHRSSRLDAATHRDFRVTHPMRTILDLASSLSEAETGRVLDQAHRRGLVDIERFGAYLALPFAISRPGSGVLREIVAVRDPSRAIESDLESILFDALRMAGLPLPVPQVWVETRKGRRRIDFAYPDRRIAIELDSWGEHGHRDAFESDRARSNELVEIGWQVLHFTWRQLRTNPIDVALTIGCALGLVPTRWKSSRSLQGPRKR